MPEILPRDAPNPVAVIGWDGIAYRVYRVHTDGTLQVRGEDQLFSIDAPLAHRVSAAISGADGYLDSGTPPAGEYWIVTGGAATDATTATTNHLHTIRSVPVTAAFHEDRRAFAIAEYSSWQGKLVLAPGDTVRVYFAGGLAGDTCIVDLVGYVMSVEP